MNRLQEVIDFNEDENNWDWKFDDLKYKLEKKDKEIETLKKQVMTL